MRGNPQYARPTPGGPPSRREDAEVGRTAVYVGRTTKNKGNPQYIRLTLSSQKFGRGHDSSVVGQGGGGGVTRMVAQWPTLAETVDKNMCAGGALCAKTWPWIGSSEEDADN